MTKEQDEKLLEAFEIIKNSEVSYVVLATDPHDKVGGNKMAKHHQFYNATPMEAFQMIVGFILQDGREEIREMLEVFFSNNVDEIKKEMDRIVKDYKNVN